MTPLCTTKQQFAVSVRRLGHLPVTEDSGVRFSVTAPLDADSKHMQLGTVDREVLEVRVLLSRPLDLRDMAEWQTRLQKNASRLWGIGSAATAPALQAGFHHGCKSHILHQSYSNSWFAPTDLSTIYFNSK